MGLEMNDWFDALGRRFAEAAKARGADIATPELDPMVADEVLELARVAAHTKERRRRDRSQQRTERPTFELFARRWEKAEIRYGACGVDQLGRILTPGPLVIWVDPVPSILIT